MRTVLLEDRLTLRFPQSALGSYRLCMGVPQAGLRLNMWCSLGILVVIASIAFGLPALDRAVPGDRPLAPGTAYHVTDDVFVVPPAGAAVELGQTRAGRDTGQALFVLGGVRLAVMVSHNAVPLGDATDRLLTRLRDSLGASPGSGYGPLVGVAPDLGRAGRFRIGDQDGWFAVRVLAPETIVEIAATGQPAALASRLSEIEASVAGIGRRG